MCELHDATGNLQVKTKNPLDICSKCLGVCQWDMGNEGEWYEEIEKGREYYVEVIIIMRVIYIAPKM